MCAGLSGRQGAIPRASHLDGGDADRNVRRIDVGKLESAHGGQNGLLFVLAILGRIREELFGIQWAERAQYIKCLLGDAQATTSLQSRDRAKHVRTQKLRTRLLGVVDDLK